METASRYGSKPNTYTSTVASDVKLQVAVKGEGPRVGEDACLFFTLNNSSSEMRSMKLYCQVAIMHYTGVLRDTVKKDEIVVKLKPSEGARLLRITALTHILM